MKLFCKHKNIVVPERARQLLSMEGESIVKDGMIMMTARLSNIFGNCIKNNRCYCFDCEKYLKNEHK